MIQSKNSLVRPFLKWAGGKRQLLKYINKYKPRNFNSYIEPFVGGGAVFLNFQLYQPIINDYNSELINTYKVVRDNINELIELLKVHNKNNSKEYFYYIRSWDREESYSTRSAVERAARFIYLNKTGYNGLYRVNSKNQFNVPFGKYKNPNIVNEEVLRNVSFYLNESKTNIVCGDFERAVENANEGDFIYFDPPYAPLKADSKNFVSYTLGGFDYKEQERLKKVFKQLDERGCYVMLSNSSSEIIHKLYKEYEETTVIVGASRSVNSKASGRGKVNEVIVMNYNFNS